MIQITEKQFIDSINDVLRSIHYFHKYETNKNTAQSEFLNQISNIKYNITFIKSVLENNSDYEPNLVINKAINDFEYFTACFLGTYANEDDPIDKLLNWGTMSNPDRSFILDESYDVLGKEDARSLKYYIRQVVLKYAPHKANF